MDVDEVLRAEGN